MKCDTCQQDIVFTSISVTELGKAEVLNRYSGLVGRVSYSKEETRVVCIACPQEMDYVQTN